MSNVVGVIGAGAGGTALAQTLALSGHDVKVWDKNKTKLDYINKHHENLKSLPGYALSERLSGEAHLNKLVQACKVIFVVLPPVAQTEVAAQIAANLTEQHILVQASAGLRQSDGALLTTVWEEVLTKKVPQVVLAGPNFAIEMLEEKFTAFLLASTDAAARKQVADLFTVPFIRPYLSADPVGAQVGGALRNVLAIAAGLTEGMGQGINAQAAILCRGIWEMQRMGVALGAQEKTMTGLSGLGDVMLNATSKLSRNYRFGVLVGQGMPVDEAADKIGLVEGLVTARMVAYVAASNGLDLPIIAAVDGILSGDISPQKVYEILITRPIGMEFAS